MNVGAMSDRIWIAKAGYEFRPTWNVANSAAVDSVDHQHALDQKRVLFGALPDTKSVENRQGVGCNLQADSHLTEFRGLLAHDDREILLRQCERAGEAANASAGKYDRMLVAPLEMHLNGSGSRCLGA